MEGQDGCASGASPNSVPTSNYSWLLRVPSRLGRLGGKEAGMDEGGSEVGAKERNGASKAGWETEQRGQVARQQTRMPGLPEWKEAQEETCKGKTKRKK